MSPRQSVAPSNLETIAPARHAVALENDSTSEGFAEFPSPYCTVYVGTGGDISVYPTRNSQPVTYRNVPDGKSLSVLCRAINWLDTTASDIVVEY